MSSAIHRLKSGGVIATYRCTSKCGHCAYLSGAGWPRDYITIETASRIGQVIRSLGCYSVHIGGGEPCIDFDRLVETVEALVDASVGIDYIETNASWYRDPDQASRMLVRLMNAGAHMLLVSISPFHNEYIPLAKTLGVMEACESSGMSVFPWGSQFLDEMSELDPSATHRIEEYEDRFGPGYRKSIPRRFWIEMRGRAIETFSEFADHRSAEEICAQAGACAELTDVSHFHVDLYGNYVPGICSGLSIDIEDLGAPLSRDDYPFLTVLSEEGVSGLYRIASEEFGFLPRESYSGKCDLCYDLRRFLALECDVESRDLEPSTLYAQMSEYPQPGV